MADDKGLHVTSQLSIYNMLIETRILMQKIDVEEADCDELAELVQTFIDLKQALCENNTTAITFQPASTDLLIHLQSLTCQQTPLTLRTLQKWTTKISLATPTQTQFKSINTSTLEQITRTLTDFPRLLKRSQLDRENCDAGVYEEEMYNDTDFYQDLIESKISDPNDPIATSMKIIQLKQLQDRKKKKNTVDTRASKGRKIRYVAHEPLMNFMAPVPTSTWSEEMKTELFKTLFGYGQQQNEQQEPIIERDDGFRIM